MTDDERQRLMDFILEQQAATGVKLDQLGDSHKQLLDSHRRDSIRLDRDEPLLTLMIGGQAGTSRLTGNSTNRSAELRRYQSLDRFAVANATHRA